MTEVGQKNVFAKLLQSGAGVARQPIGDDLLLVFHCLYPNRVTGDATPARCLMRCLIRRPILGGGQGSPPVLRTATNSLSHCLQTPPPPGCMMICLDCHS